MDLASALISEHFADAAGELVVAGVPVSAIASEFGTPLYVYAADVLDRAWARLRGAYPSEFDISYSVKANPNPAILRRLLGNGCGLEVASAGELGLALGAGCPPERIMFAGPGKTEVELQIALTQGIGEIHVESLTEAGRVSSIAGRLGMPARVAVRINPAAEAQGGAMRMGGKAAPFGIDEELLDQTLDELMALPHLELRGIHLFAGTQVLDYAVLTRQYEKGLDLARRTAARLGHALHTLDFGGGLGVPYFPGESPLDMDALHAELARLVTETRGDRHLQGTRFVIEPGRYLVAEAGIYVARVTDIKVSRGKTFLILDGGMNHHLAASGNLGQVIKRNFPLAVLNKIGKEATQRADVVGPLCTPLDTLVRDVPLPATELGDLVGIFQSGAYGLTASPTHFLSHPVPAEVLVADGRARLIRRRRPIAEISDDFPRHDAD